MNQCLGKMFIHPELTFESLVVDDGNRRAHEASLAVAGNPGEVFNPLFIYSPQGCGGTHLSQAILNHVLKEGTIDRDRMCWITGEEFVNGLIHSIRSEVLPCFRTYFSNLDMLFIDDVEYLQGKVQAQEELRHTFDTLYDDIKQIVITCGCHPRELNDTEELLRSRFEWGSIEEIRMPELQTKLTILERLAYEEGVELSHDVALYLAGDSTASAREIMGKFTRLLAASHLRCLPISIDLAKDVLQRIYG